MGNICADASHHQRRKRWKETVAFAFTRSCVSESPESALERSSVQPALTFVRQPNLVAMEDLARDRPSPAQIRAGCGKRRSTSFGMHLGSLAGVEPCRKGQLPLLILCRRSGHCGRRACRRIGRVSASLTDSAVAFESPCFCRASLGCRFSDRPLFGSIGLKHCTGRAAASPFQTQTQCGGGLAFALSVRFQVVHVVAIRLCSARMRMGPGGVRRSRPSPAHFARFIRTASGIGPPPPRSASLTRRGSPLRSQRPSPDRPEIFPRPWLGPSLLAGTERSKLSEPPSPPQELEPLCGSGGPVLGRRRCPRESAGLGGASREECARMRRHTAI